MPPHVGRMAIVAGWGFLLAKLFVVGFQAVHATGDGFVAAAVSSLGVDVAVVLWLVALGWVARGARPAGDAWGPRVEAAVGGLLAIYALLNVFFMVEIGRPVDLELLRADAGLGEAGTMLRSDGGTLALGAIALYALSIRRVVRFAEARLRASGPAVLGALGLYGITAVVFVQANPTLAATWGLQRNAVAEIVLDLTSVASGPGPVAAMAAPTVAASWTSPVHYDATTRPRHVVLWLAESIGARYTTLFDEDLPSTPHLARLREHAVQFRRFYANIPLSSQSIFATLCGLHAFPANQPIWKLNPRIGCPSLGETLAARGYRTALFTGALFSYGEKDRFLRDRGWDRLIDGDNVPGKERYWRDGWGVDDAAIVDAALAWIDENPDQPSLTVMIPIIPHVPYGLPPGTRVPFVATDRKARYLGGVFYSDALFGRFYDGYVARGLAADTLFVYAGDHGEAFDQHPGNRNHASFVHEENVHVPLLFINERMFPTAQESFRMGSHADLAPTILDLLGQPVPEGYQGASLVADDFEDRPVFLNATVRDRLAGLRDGDYKYIFNVDTGVEEIYDLARDPLEKHNLVEGFDAARREGWRAQVVTYEREQRAFLTNHPPRVE